MSSLYRLLRRNFSTITTTISIKAASNDLYKERDLSRVVEKFKKYSAMESFRKRSGIYENTVRRLASAKRFECIAEIIEEQKQYNDISKEGFSARLISLYGKSGMYKNAQSTFDELPEKNCKRTVLSMNALLAAYLHSKKFDMVHQLFKELPTKLLVEPDLVSYNTVINALSKIGSWDAAMSMVEEMEKKGLKPDVITFTILLSGLYKTGRFSDGEKIWNQMGEKNVTHNIRTYNARLVGLAKEKKMREVVNLFEKMSTEGVKPDIFSFNALIEGFVNDDNLEEAKKWYGEIANTDYDPDKNTFAIFLRFLCEKGELNTAFEVCKEIFNIECLVDAALLQSVVDKLVDNSMSTEAKKIVHLGKTNRYCRYKLNLPSDK